MASKMSHPLDPVSTPESCLLIIGRAQGLLPTGARTESECSKRTMPMPDNVFQAPGVPGHSALETQPSLQMRARCFQQTKSMSWSLGSHQILARTASQSLVARTSCALQQSPARGRPHLCDSLQAQLCGSATGLNTHHVPMKACDPFCVKL